MKKYTPPVVFDDTLVRGDAVGALKELGADRAPVFNLPVDEITVLPDFNPRVVGTEDYEEHIDALVASIQANGFLPNKPLSVYPAEEEVDGEKVTVFYVTDGHSRLEAVRRFNALEGVTPIKALPVSVAPRDVTLADLTVQTVLNNNSTRPLSPLELAIVTARLRTYNVSETDIARRLGLTTRYVNDLKALLDAPASVKKAVQKGEVSATLAIQEVRQHGADGAAARLEEAVKKAKEGGKKKVTAKALPKAKPTAADKKKVAEKVEKAKAKAPKADKQAGTKTVEPKAETALPAQPATDLDFYKEAINYAIALPKKGTTATVWLTSFMAEDSGAIGELEAWMGQPAGAFFDSSLRVPVDKEGI